MIALSNNQPIMITLWGIWLLIRYPLIGFVVIEEKFTVKQNHNLIFVFIVVLVVEILTQVLLRISGIPNGDDNAGTFYPKGTGSLVFLLIVFLCFFAGKWISERKSICLILTLFLGIFSSSLGEMKLFFFAAIVIMSMSILLFIRRNKINKRLILGIISILIFIFCFPIAIDKLTYNESTSIPFFSQITDISYIKKYTSFVSLDKNGRYDVGRNYAVQYVWNMISSDDIRFLFGDGIGSRGESKTIGSAGVQLLRGDLGLFTGSSLVVFLGEMGVMGIIYISVFIIFTIVRCLRIIRSNQAPYLVSIGYAVLLFSIFWPIWIWYNTAWVRPGSMPIYWLMWGIVMHYSKKCFSTQKARDAI